MGDRALWDKRLPLDALDPPPPVDQAGTGPVERARQAVRVDRSAPAPSDVPGWWVEGPRAFRVQRAGHGDHVVHIVPLGQTGPQEDAADMDVISNVTAAQVLELYPQGAGEDLDGHGRLLLADTGELLEPAAQLRGARCVGPELGGVAVIAIEQDLRCLCQPVGDVVHEPVQLRLPLYRGADGIGISSQLAWTEVAQPLAKMVGERSGPLGHDAHVGDHGQ